MSLASSIGRSVYFKKETSWGVAAGTGSALTARRTAITLNLKRNQYRSKEIRTDQQRVKGQFGGAHVEGTLDGEMSGGTYQLFYEAIMRAAASAVTSITAMTIDVAGAGPTYTFTRSAGDYITGNVRVGQVVRFTLGLNAATLNRNIFVTALTSSILTGYPLDGGTIVTESAVSGVTLTVPGKRIIVPSTGHTENSFTMEDVITLTSPMHRHFLGMELNTLTLNIPPEDEATVSFGWLGKSMTVDTTPYFVTPTAQTNTPVVSGPNGILLIAGAPIAIATSLQMTMNGNLSTEPVIGSTVPPAVFQGPFEGNGSLTAFVQDSAFFDYFTAGTSFGLAMYLPESSAPDAHFQLVHLPECTASDVNLDDARAMKITVPFDFNKIPTTTGYDSTTCSIQDSQFA